MTRSILLTLAVFLGVCSLAASTDAFHNPQEDVLLFYNIFKDWATQSNRQYGVEEMAIRFHNWKSNFDFVQQQNAQEGLTHKLEMNEFADMTAEEFSALHMGLNLDLLGASKKYQKNSTTTRPSTNHSNATNYSNATNQTNETMFSKANRWDWRKASAVSTVKNQGICGGCWSFAASGALEGLHAIKNKKLTSLSVQQMIDCSSLYGNQGCDGGLMTTAFSYTQNSGIQPEHSYQYTAAAGDCQENSNQVVFKNNGYQEVPANDFAALKLAVARQPVSVGIDASSLTVQLFKNGVIKTGCETGLNHAVLIVGYDVDKSGQSYWICKNSWGPKWGLKGYFHVAMGDQNSGQGVCGINMLASYPTL